MQLICNYNRPNLSPSLFFLSVSCIVGDVGENSKTHSFAVALGLVDFFLTFGQKLRQLQLTGTMSINSYRSGLHTHCTTE